MRLEVGIKLDARLDVEVGGVGCVASVGGDG